jgi:flagellar protein FliO/FliZ
MTSWLVDTFQMEPGWARGIGFFIAVVVVLALISVFVWVLRRIAGTRVMGGRSRQPRVSVMDAAALDARRRLILIRRDNVEHLLLVGGPSDVVVERNIVRGVPVSQAYPRQSSQPPADVAAASLAPVESAPPQPQPEPAPRAPAQRPAAPPPPAAAPAPRRMAPVPPAAPAAPVTAQQPQPIRPSPRAATPPPRAPSADAPAAGSADAKRPTPLHRAGASVAAAGAAVAGLARSGGSALRGSDQASEAAPRADTPPAPRRTITPPSSGPASTARTAYPQPGDEPKASDVAPSAASGNGAPPRPSYVKPPVEPVAARQPSPDTPAKEPAATAPEIKAPEPAKPAKDESTAAPDAPVRAPTASGPAQSASSGSWPSAPASSWKDKPAAGLAASSKSEAASPTDTPVERAEPSAEKQASKDTVLSEPSAPTAAVAQETPSKVSAGDLEDALMAEFNQSRKPPAAAEATATQDTVTEAPAKSESAAPDAEMDKQAGSSDTSSQGTAPADDKKDPANAVTMDAIEEEMARLLSEIGGSKSK